MSRREQLLIVIGLAVVIVLGFYYLVYQPRTAEYGRLVTEKDARQARLDQMQAVAAQTERLERRYGELQAFIATIEAKLPTQKEVPALLVQLERLTTQQKVELQAIRPGALEAVSAGGQTTRAGGTAPAAGAAPSSGTARPAQARPEYFRFPIGLTFRATYNQYVSVLAALRDFPRLIAVTSVRMTPGSKLPELNVQVDSETYVLPKEAP
jgi:Tfp pilus assembly protein PilO